MGSGQGACVIQSKSLCALAVAAIVSLAFPAVAAPIISSIGYPPFPDPDAYSAAVVAFGVSRDGNYVAGTHEVSTQDSRAFRYNSGGGMVLESDPNVDWSSGKAVNNAGVVVGVAYVPAQIAYASRAARVTAGGVTQVLPGLRTSGDWRSEANAINNAGVIVGSAQSITGHDHPFRYTDAGGIQDLGTPSFTDNGIAYDINESGVIVGTSDGRRKGWRYTSANGFTLLGAPNGYDYSDARAVNDAGTITGQLSFGFITYRAFRHTGSTFQVLAPFGGDPIGLDINSAGFVVGDSDGGNGFGIAALWKLDGSVVNLDNWLNTSYPAEGAKWTLRSASGITDSGLIVGYGDYNDGPGGLANGRHAFVLDASSLIPEPASALMTLSALMLALGRRRCERAADH
jgi:probable HAF family extracellular repeat protein